MKKNISKILILITALSLLLLSACSNNDDNNNDNYNNNNNKDNVDYTDNYNDNNMTDDNNMNDDDNVVAYSLKEFNQCLSDKGVVIYGSDWCPACQALVSTLGGKEAVTPVYVECTQNQERCANEAKTGYVPEIQINGEVYQGQRSIQALTEITGCQAPN